MSPLHIVPNNCSADDAPSDVANSLTTRSPMRLAGAVMVCSLGVGGWGYCRFRRRQGQCAERGRCAAGGHRHANVSKGAFALGGAHPCAAASPQTCEAAIDDSQRMR